VSATIGLSRREFMVAMMLAGGGLPAWPAASLAAKPVTAAVPVISFHMDQPYIDHAGAAVPYHAPVGARAAGELCLCSEEMLRHHHCYAL
jgi:hypothetical protein